MSVAGRRYGVWKANVNWTSGKIDITPNWAFALPAWILPALIGEWTVQCMGGQVIGFIAGGLVSLLKSYHDFYRMMAAYAPMLNRKIRWARIAAVVAVVIAGGIVLLLLDFNPLTGLLDEL
mgnify:CR=1 FL=1